MNRSLALALASYLAASPALAGTITVDDDQIADYATIDGAIAAASPGDVILVQPGTYPPFHLDKSLSILGPAGGPRPIVTGASTIDGAVSFQLAALELGQLTVTGAHGRGAIDACRLVHDGIWVLKIDGCAQVLVTRTDVLGTEGSTVGAAASVASSTVAFVDCTLRGGNGTSPEAADGADGLFAIAADVMLAECDVSGGDGGRGGFSMIYGDGGDGVRAIGSKVVVRAFGSAIAYGHTQDPTGFGDGAHVSAQDSTVVYSGIAFVGAPKVGGVGSTFLAPDPPEPVMTIGGGDLPGQPRTMLLFGPAGANAFAVVSLQAAKLVPPTIEGAVWIGPSGIVQILPLVTAGAGLPVTYSWPVPPSLVGLEGLALQMQSAFPFLPGTIDPAKSTVTNPANAILRFVEEHDCNGNGVDDALDIASGASFDCNADGIPDECQDDCNGNGLDDSCDIAAGTSADCNANGVPDECEVAATFTKTLAHAPLVGGLAPIELLLPSPPTAAGPVTLSVLASGDLDETLENLSVYVHVGASSTVPLGLLFSAPGEGGHCSAVPDADSLTIPASTFNLAALLSDGKVRIGVDVPAAVGDECPGSYLQATVSYVIDDDCNANGVPDECDIASGTSLDLNLDGVPDECQP